MKSVVGDLIERVVGNSVSLVTSFEHDDTKGLFLLL